MKTAIAILAGMALGACALASAQKMTAAAASAPEKPAYLVVLGDVKDREAFAAGYVAKLPPVYAKYGGAYLAVGRNFETLEGEAGFQSVVISRWPSMAAGRAFWNSPEYKELQKARVDGDWGRFDVFLVEGLPRPQ
jgi:uncharacterized protein (DUF1330 family)